MMLTDAQAVTILCLLEFAFAEGQTGVEFADSGTSNKWLEAYYRIHDTVVDAVPVSDTESGCDSADDMDRALQVARSTRDEYHGVRPDDARH